MDEKAAIVARCYPRPQSIKGDLREAPVVPCTSAEFWTKVKVLECNLLQAARQLREMDSADPCILCVAFKYAPGGSGGTWGTGQTAHLCRSTTFQVVADRRLYPLTSWEYLYTPGVWVFADEPQKKHFRVSVLAAPLPERPSSLDTVAERVRYAKDLESHMQAILRICHAHGHRSLVLRAFALPEHALSDVAVAWRSVLLTSGDCVGRFQNVIFANEPYLRDQDELHMFRAVFSTPLASKW